MRPFIIILCLIVLANESTAQNAAGTECKPLKASPFSVGGGFSSFHLIGGYGGHIKLEYRPGKKLVFAAKSILTNNLWEDYELPSDQLGPGMKVDYHSGRALSALLEAEYYLIGNNRPEQKAGIYAGAGLGYNSVFMRSNSVRTAPVTDPAYGKFRNDFGSRDFTCVLSLGFDRKYRKGRFYAEVLYAWAVRGTEYSHYYYDAVPDTGKIPNQHFSGNREFEAFPYVSIGYRRYLRVRNSEAEKSSQDIQECPVKLQP